MRKIIHIKGVSGSGKSTLGKIIKHRFKNMMIIDTDDIYDSNFLNLFENNKEFRDMVYAGKDEYQETHNKLNIKTRDHIIKKNKDINVVFVGMTIPISDIANYSYILDTPLDLNFKQVNIRTLNDLCKNKKDIKDMFKYGISPSVINVQLLFKYKVRHIFPYNYGDVGGAIERLKKNAKKENSKIMTGQEILMDLESILEPMFDTSKKLEHFVIHVTGPQGSGKTYMGNEFQLIYGDIIYVKDLDDLFMEYNTYPSPESEPDISYQEYIQKYINTHLDKPIIFVGLDAEMCLGAMKDSNVHYDLKSKYNFYIDLPEEDLLRQRFNRQVSKLYERKNELFDLWKDNPKKIQDKLIRYINLNQWTDNNERCKEYHKKRNYKMMTYTDIMEYIHQILK